MGRTKHTLPRDEKTKGGLRTANTDGGGQNHTLSRDEGEGHDRQDCMQMRQV